MGNTGSVAGNWSVDNWPFSTGENAVSIETVINETSKIPKKYFGGEAIENDPSINQMQRDLLAFDETIINMFRRNKSTEQVRKTTDEYYRQQCDQRSSSSSQANSAENDGDYLQAAFVDDNGLPAVLPVSDSSTTAPQTSSRSILGCSHFTTDSKTTEYVCRQCNQAETSL